ncbi:hypothetical protein [Algicella marina]|uniref:Uncharacterized protein n=1 Tax=Algicella marina TaxID=2683284 RepID=A0A6P1T0Y2_9RHOB|nr:hypothetical protein [Algicella marina]QHQ35303.1 hypothetical protein GO499_08875 [Algicella marina]
MGFLTIGVLAGYLFLFPPIPFPPEIGRGLPIGFAQADSEFKQRVASHFALPISETELTSRLQDQGFTIERENRFAVFEKARFPCTLFWRVHWESEKGTVASIYARYGGSCL